MIGFGTFQPDYKKESVQWLRQNIERASRELEGARVIQRVVDEKVMDIQLSIARMTEALIVRATSDDTTKDT